MDTCYSCNVKGCYDLKIFKCNDFFLRLLTLLHQLSWKEDGYYCHNRLRMILHFEFRVYKLTVTYSFQKNKPAQFRLRQLTILQKQYE